MRGPVQSIPPSFLILSYFEFTVSHQRLPQHHTAQVSFFHTDHAVACVYVFNVSAWNIVRVCACIVCVCVCVGMCVCTCAHHACSSSSRSPSRPSDKKDKKKSSGRRDDSVERLAKRRRDRDSRYVFELGLWLRLWLRLWL